MGERTNISWTHHTFNPWWGCTEISPACDACYAREWAKRFGVKWGVGQPRRVASERTWAEPLNWDRRAREAGERRRVFCASMADVFDNEAPEGARDRLWLLIGCTPNLDWLLLTKRIGNARTMLPADWGDGYANVWLGATVANQEEANRDIPKLLATPARIHFLSCEPLIEAIDLRQLLVGDRMWLDSLTGCHSARRGPGTLDEVFSDMPKLPGMLPPIDWVIAGSESGRAARPCDLNWVRGLRNQCTSVHAPFHWKQHVVDGIKTHTPELDGQRWVEFPRSAV